jgi:hypothetical protein
LTAGTVALHTALIGVIYKAMKRTTPSLKSVPPVLAATLAIVIMCGFSLRSAQAGYIVTLRQIGPDVVAIGSGTIDLADLTLLFSNDPTVNARLIPEVAQIVMGSTTGGNVSDFYTGFSGPTNFGSGFITDASAGAGDSVALYNYPPFGANELGVPTGYVSGNPLSDRDIYSGQTFSTLGVTPGTYVWTWGTGVHADSFTLRAVPDSGSTFGLLSVAFVGLIGTRLIFARHLSHVTRH